jgi:hypothetical protein
MSDPKAVLTTAWTLECTFQGSVSVPDQSAVKLHVAGAPVLLASTVASWQVSACQAVTPDGTKSPCATVTPVPTPYPPAKLTVGAAKVPVLLETFSADTIGSAVTPHAAAVSPTKPHPTSTPLKVKP